ncbi:hypothetical protein B7494_g6018 [Chlorociboria aeruginascens]|nr:hypothetical protein B7494_g6018 [Chlorociboria aeruginascens]
MYGGKSKMRPEKGAMWTMRSTWISLSEGFDEIETVEEFGGVDAEDAFVPIRHQTPVQNNGMIGQPFSPQNPFSSITGRLQTPTSRLHGVQAALPEDRERLDFTNLDLICTIDTMRIRNRWLAEFIPSPDERLKYYPSSIINFISRVFKTIFTRRQKALIITIVSTAATFSGFASNIYFPAIPTIAVDLSVSAELVNLTVTSYMILQALSPTIWGAVADVHGRRSTYICTFVVFIGACIGLAETRHYYQLVILRCLQSAGSASTIALGAGVLGDITTREERGGYMGIFQAALLAPVAVGPILGGVFAETLGWKSIFWFLTIYSGAFLIVLILFLPETLRSLVGNGSTPARGLAKPIFSCLQTHKEFQRPVELSPPPTKKLSVNFLGPITILFSLEAIIIIIFLSIYYTVWQMTITAMSTLFKRTYNLNELQIGLTFIANGVGSIAGTLSTGKLMDMDYLRVKSSYAGPPENFPLERARLRLIWIWSGLQCSAAIIFGWTVNEHVHISVPIICTFVIGWAATSIQSVVTTFMVDVFPTKSASSTAALNLSRCLMGAGGTAAVLPLTSAIGVGWTFTLLAGVLVVSFGLVGLQMRYGGNWRQKREEREKAAVES